MFICNECLKENYYNGESLFKSGGTCEHCGKKKVCNEIKSSRLVSKPEGYKESIGTLISVTGDQQHKRSFLIDKNGNVSAKEESSEILVSRNPLIPSCSHIMYGGGRAKKLKKINIVDGDGRIMTDAEIDQLNLRDKDGKLPFEDIYQKLNKDK